jgi:DNA-binding MarR family transcriptional regulator
MAEQCKHEALKALIVEIFQTNGKLLEAGDRLSADLGLTGARTQVIAALKLENRALTVAQIARRMGLQRQSVQRLVDILVTQGTLTYHPNPEHKRAKLVDFTDEGRILFGQMEDRHRQWSDHISDNFSIDELEKATALLKKLRDNLDE